MPADCAPHEADLTLEVAATLANAQVHPHSPALEPAEPAVLRAGDELGNLFASQQRLVLLIVLVLAAAQLALNQRNSKHCRRLMRARYSMTQQLVGVMLNSLQISSVSSPMISRM